MVLSPSHSSVAGTAGWCSAAELGLTSAESDCSLWSHSFEWQTPATALHRWQKNYKYHRILRLFIPLYLFLSASHHHGSWWCWRFRRQVPCRWAQTLRWASGLWSRTWCEAAGPTPPPYDPAGRAAGAGSWRCLHRRGTVLWLTCTQSTWWCRSGLFCRRCPGVHSTPDWVWCRWSRWRCCAGLREVLQRSKRKVFTTLDIDWINEDHFIRLFSTFCCDCIPLASTSSHPPNFVTLFGGESHHNFNL